MKGQSKTPKAQAARRQNIKKANAAANRKRIEHKRDIAEMAMGVRKGGIDATPAMYQKVTADVPDFAYVQDETGDLCERAQNGLVYAEPLCSNCHHPFHEEIMHLLIAIERECLKVIKKNKPILAREWNLLPEEMIALRHEDDHPFQVAARVDDEDKIVALLHDCIEDGYSSVDELVKYFDVSTIRDVVTLTRDETKETYGQYIDRIKRAGGRPQRVKLADIRSNLHRCYGHSAKSTRYQSLIKRYEKALRKLTDDV